MKNEPKTISQDVSDNVDSICTEKSNGLKNSLLSLCAIVEDQMQIAVRALLNRDEALAQAVRLRDAEIDQLEVEVEEDCLKSSGPASAGCGRPALHRGRVENQQRLGTHRRFGGQHRQKGKTLRRFTSRWRYPSTWKACARKTQAMLRDSLDALVNLESELARQVCARDDEVDAIKSEFRKSVDQRIRQNPGQIEFLLILLAVSRNLERVADHATNIAEDVIYMVEGKIIRHAEGE